MNFLLLNISALVIAYISFIPIPIPKCLVYIMDRYFLLIDGKLTITGKKMTITSTFHNNLMIICLTALMYSYGNCADRSFPPLGLLSFPIFGYTAQIRALQFSITPYFWYKLSIIAKLFIAILFGLFSTIVLYQIYLSKINGELIITIISTIPIMFYITNYYYLLESPKWHSYHWFIGYYMCIIARYDTFISNLIFSIFWGIFLEGAFTFGIIPILNEKPETNDNFSLQTIIKREDFGDITEISEKSIKCGDMHLTWPLARYCKTIDESKYIQGFYDGVKGLRCSENYYNSAYMKGNLDFYNTEYQELLNYTNN